MSKIKNRKGNIKMWIVILVIAILIAAGLVGGILADAPGRREIEALAVSEVDFGNLRDGTYIGEYKGTKSHIRDIRVQVMISGGSISDVKILKGAVDNEGKSAKLAGGKSIEDLFGDVIKSQSLQVDVISGAIITSKTHLKALENALEQAQPK